MRPGQAPSSLFRKPLRALQSLRTESDVQFFRDLYMEWLLLVMDFTCRDLTRDSDRLPALSGLADWMQRQTDDLYLCGLWARNLLFELLWYVEASTQETHWRLVEPYAPSWSWASITGPVTYYRPYVTQFGQRYPGYQEYEVDVSVSNAHTDRDETPVKIVDFAVHPFGLNKYGPGQAFVELCGHVLPVKYDQSRELWESPIITMAHFDPKWLEFKYDIYSEIPDILVAASSEETFVLLFMGIVVPPGGGYTVGSHHRLFASYSSALRVEVLWSWKSKPSFSRLEHLRSFLVVWICLAMWRLCVPVLVFYLARPPDRDTQSRDAHQGDDYRSIRAFLDLSALEVDL